jgi:serine phosphatase RsbU (regulator of sigma subunit)
MPALRGLKGPHQIHAISRPARTFTGDFYFTHRHDDRLWIALGDVAGKGLPAAIVMAMIQEELEHRINSCAITECDPSATMLRLHEFLRPVLPSNRFATAVIGHLHDDGTLTVANAGHVPPLILRAGGWVEEIGSTGPVAGLIEGSKWRTFTTTLEEGDALVLYSDGVTEATIEDEELGVCGLRKMVERIVSRGAKDIVAEIMNAMERTVRADDLTVLVLA